MTRLGDLLDFGQLFKAFGNNWFTLISHILILDLGLQITQTSTKVDCVQHLED